MLSLSTVQDDLNKQLANLRPSLGLKDEEGLTPVQSELVLQFHKKTGFAKFWLSYWNKATLAPALTFDALMQLKNFSQMFMKEIKPAQAAPEDQAFLELFPLNQNDPYAPIVEVLNQATHSRFLSLRSTLCSTLASSCSDADKNAVVRNFLSELRNQLKSFSDRYKSSDPRLSHKALLIAAHMNSALDEHLIKEWKFPADESISATSLNAPAAEPSKGLPPIDLPKINLQFNYFKFFWTSLYEFKPAHPEKLARIETDLGQVLEEQRTNQNNQQALQRQIIAAKKEAPSKLALFFDDLIRSFHSALSLSGKNKGAPVLSASSQSSSASPDMSPSNLSMTVTHTKNLGGSLWERAKKLTPNPFKRKAKDVDESVFTLPDNPRSTEMQCK